VRRPRRQLIGAAGGIVFALASLWFLSRLGDQPHYLSQ
jgi:hypothetical protein